MGKQIDFDFRVYPVGGSTGYDHVRLSNEIRTQYLENGWDVLNTEIAQVGGNELRLAITFVRYQEIPSVVPVVEAEKRGPGRPKKEEVVPT